MENGRDKNNREKDSALPRLLKLFNMAACLNLPSARHGGKLQPDSAYLPASQQ